MSSAAVSTLWLACVAQGCTYDREVTEEQPEVRAELARLRKLEQGLRAERERIRAAAAGEVHQLQTALRETAARAAQSEREAQGLRAQVQRGSGGIRLRRRRWRSDQDSTGAVQRVLTAFERERQQLEERARAVAQTELRQRKTQAQLDAEIARLAKANEGDDGREELLSELRAAESRVAELERQLIDHEETKVALDAARGELTRLAHVEPPPPAPREDLQARESELLRREEELSRREIELSLLRGRIGEEERRLQERAWRTGPVARRRRGETATRQDGELTFSEGWRLLSRGGEAPVERPDWGDGNW